MIFMIRKLAHLSLIGAFCASILAISGCAKYRPHALEIPKTIAQEQQELEVTAQALTEKECRKIFSRRILNKQYQPIQLVIKNKSKHTYILDAANIELQIEPTDLVAQQLKLNTAGRVISWAVGGLFLWPLYISAIVEGCRSHDANMRLSRDFSHRTISDDARIFIHPNSMINKVFFVTDENYRHRFNLHLFNKETDELVTFDIRT